MPSEAIRIDTVEIAKFMRAELKEVFPQTSFSVRKEGYDSITVEWTDGPTQSEVEYLLSQFNGYAYEGNNNLGSDYGDYRSRTSYREINGKTERVQYTLKYLNCSRSHSDLFLATISAQVSEQYQLEPLTIKPSNTTGKIHTTASIEHSGQRIGNDWAENVIYRVMRSTSAIDYTLKSSPADKFRKAADALQKTIDDKRRQRPTHTRRMKAMADSALEDALKLEYLQDKLRALADAWDQDRVPELLRSVGTKAQIEHLAHNAHREVMVDLYHPDGGGRGDYLMMAKIGLGTRERYLNAVRAVRELGDPNAGKKSQADELRDLEQQLLLKKIQGFFPTPNSVIDRMFSELPATAPGMRILEPSAGNGRLAERLRERFPDATLDVCEWNYDLGKVLKLKGFNLIATDCFDLKEPVYDLAVCNPPFEDLADIDHVRHYYTLLKPGGTLISVMSESPFFSKKKKAEEFREWLAEYGTDYDLPADAFKDGERPTGVKTRYVVIEKPGEIKPLHTSPYHNGQRVFIKTAGFEGVIDNIRFDGVHFLTVDKEYARKAFWTALAWELEPIKVDPQPVFTIGQQIEHAMLKPDGTPTLPGWKPYTVVDLDATRLKIDLGNNNLWVPKSECRPIPQTATDAAPVPSCDRCGEVKPLVNPDAPEGDRICQACFDKGICKTCGKELTRAEVDLNTCWQCERVNAHYQQIAEASRAEAERSGIQPGNRVQINWTTTRAGYGTMIRFSDTNAGWVLIEDDEQKRRYWIALSILSKLSDSRAIVPTGERFTVVEATFKKSLSVQPALRILPKPLPKPVPPVQQSLIGLPPQPTLFDLTPTEPVYNYAVNIADAAWHTDTDLPLKLLLQPVLSKSGVIQCERDKMDGTGSLLECDAERAKAIIEVARKKYKKHELRFYYSKYGQSWQRV